VSDEDIKEAMEFVVDGRVEVNYSVIGLSKLSSVFELMSKGEMVGCVILDPSR